MSTGAKEVHARCPTCGAEWTTVFIDDERALRVKCTCGISFEVYRPTTTCRPIAREVLGFLNDLCHPEQYGYAVTKEVRQRARALADKIETEEQMP